jgi:imidazole glycerol-phosphate synthase
VIIIPDIECGNVQSLKNVMEYANLDVETVVSSDPSILQKCDTLILPGVGNFGNFMTEIVEKSWFDMVMKHHREGGKIVGICVGFQSFFENSEEAPDVPGFGFFRGKVQRMDSERSPVIGYAPVSQNYLKVGDFYFVHSYGVQAEKFHETNSIIYSYSNSAGRFIAGVQKNHILGVQFHPEKSGKVGMEFLVNFLKGRQDVSS